MFGLILDLVKRGSMIHIQDKAAFSSFHFSHLKCGCESLNIKSNTHVVMAP